MMNETLSGSTLQKYPEEIVSQHLLLVEGFDDVAFFKAMTRREKCDDIEVRDVNGKDNFKAVLPGIVKSSGFSNVNTLGIVRDANDNYKGAFDSICSALKRANLPEPDAPLKPKGSNPKVIVLVLPHVDSAGELEDLCLEAVADDPAINCVDEYFECLESVNSPIPKKLSKAKAHVFLASRENPGMRIGEAAEKDYWKFESAVYKQVKSFLRMVAGKKVR